MQELGKGQKIKLERLDFVKVGLSIVSKATIDISCFGVDTHDKLSDDRYFVFYNQKSSPNREIVSNPQFGDNETFEINLKSLPSTIAKLVFTATIDGEGDFSTIGNSYIRIFDNKQEVYRFSFNGSFFEKEKAIIISEIYIKDNIWRLGCVAQGFNGGLSALLKNFGGEEAKEEIKETPKQVEKIKLDKKVQLEKRVKEEAPQLVNLTKSLIVSLEKKNLFDIIAKVALVLDASGSMYGQYQRGDVQLIVDRVMPIALCFDDDGEIEAWAFAEDQKRFNSVTTKNISNYVNKEWGGWDNWMSKLNASINNEPVVMRDIFKTYNDSDTPVFVIFISDGGVGYNDQIEQILIESSRYPIFWQFIGIGGSNYGILQKLDDLKGRYVDNCNFFSLDHIKSITDEKLYELLLNEFPIWLKDSKVQAMLSKTSSSITASTNKSFFGSIFGR
jgi:stress response protein SCP2